ncbi:MAG: type A chloramphenicol O-acetyltransferase [Clostridia bacterium]|nr:type A chloramphenicol O-acetyltransferase [Clostridia bacterium]
MKFELLDFDKWERCEYYKHYTKEVVCSYSMTVNIDISNLRNHKLYPTMLWLLTKTVNKFPEFRTALTEKGLGVYDNMLPAYTIFNKDKKNFSVIWSEYSEDYGEFLKNYNADVEKYKNSIEFFPKKNRPANTFDVSMIPWATFSSFNINTFNSDKYFLPIFTMGKYFEQDGKRYLPLSIQVHHAVCDGFHVSMFIDSLQNEIRLRKKQ